MMDKQIDNIKGMFAERGFKFSEGKFRSEPRYFGVAEGCTLELVGSEDVMQATIVAIMAPDRLDLARVNAVRLVALVALLAGETGARWTSEALKRASSVQVTEARIKSEVEGFDVRFVANRRKSTVTLKAWRLSGQKTSDVAQLAIGLIERNAK